MIASGYTHPVELVISNMVPILFSLIILRDKMHMLTLVSWLILALIELKEGHSGFDMPYSMFKVIPFSVNSVYHSYHHSRNIGNYAGITTIWDSLFRTNKAYLEYIQENEKTD